MKNYSNIAAVCALLLGYSSLAYAGPPDTPPPQTPQNLQIYGGAQQTADLAAGAPMPEGMMDCINRYIMQHPPQPNNGGGNTGVIGGIVDLAQTVCGLK